MFFFLILAIFIGTIAMIAVYALPTEKMYHHVQGITEMYHSAETQPRWATGWHTALDNFTDSVMLMTAIHPSSGSVVADAMSNARWNHYSESSDNPVSYMIDKTQRNEQIDTSPPVLYPRYWHGYLTVLKPLLLATKVQNIRILNSYLQFLLLLTVMFAIYKQLGTAYVVAFSLTVLTINPVTTALSFQNSTIFYIILVSVLILMKWNDIFRQKKLYPYFFLWIGICTAFFDFWTYPVTSIGIPLIFVFLLNKSSYPSIATWLGDMFHNIAAWGFGYVGMWSGKLMMYTCLMDSSVIADTMNYITQYQMKLDVSPTVSMTPVSAIHQNLLAFWKDPLNIILILSLIYFLFRCVSGKHLTAEKVTVIAFLSIGLLPFLWYSIVPKHSYIHIFFTYRELATTVFSITCLALSMMPKKSY